MQLTLNGKNIEITDAIKTYVNEKIDRVTKHNKQIMSIKVTLNVNKNRSVKKNCTAESTCFLNGSVIKIQETAETMYAAIDLLADKLDRQVKEIKEKIIRKNKSATETIRTGAIEEELEEEIEEEETEEEFPEEIVKIEIE